MFIVINAICLMAAVLLILVIAATASIPSRHAIGFEPPEGEWLGPNQGTGRGTARVLRSRPVPARQRSVGVTSH